MDVQLSAEDEVGEIVENVDKEQLNTCIQILGRMSITLIFFIVIFTLFQFSQKHEGKK